MPKEINEIKEEKSPRIFAGFNPSGDFCPFCKTKADTETVLIPIPGTEDGNNMKAKQVHLKCYDLFIEMMELEQNKHNENQIE